MHISLFEDTTRYTEPKTSSSIIKTALCIARKGKEMLANIKHKYGWDMNFELSPSFRQYELHVLFWHIV